MLAGVFSFLACPDADLCNTGGQFEDSVMAVKQVMEDSNVLGWGLILSISVTFFNYSNMYHQTCVLYIQSVLELNVICHYMDRVYFYRN